MNWIEFLSTFLGTALTALSVVGVVSQYLKYAHKNISQEAIKWRDLERDLAHLKRNRDAYTDFVEQVSDDIKSIELTQAGLQGQITTIRDYHATDETQDKIENLLIRVSKLESENRILLAEKFGTQSL